MGIEDLVDKDLYDDSEYCPKTGTHESEIMEPDNMKMEDLADTLQTKNSDFNEGPKKPNAELLIKIAEDNCEQFFKDEYGNTFALAKVGNHKEVIDLESTKFKRFLSKTFFDVNDGRVAGSDAINNAIQVLQAKAEHEGKIIPLSLRVAFSEDRDEIYYDLTDEKWRCIKISKNGWNIVNNLPILFTRYNQIPQIEPSKLYDPNIFEKFLDLANIGNESNRHLLKVYIVSMLVPDIPHVMLQLYGEKGSSKSTLQTFIKKIVDPSKPMLLTIHNDKTEFIQQVSHSYVLCYDNVKYVPGWLPDEVCKAITGSGMTKRKLYTNNEDVVYEYKRCICLNGININLTEPDALDRSILIELPRIRKENRQPESKILRAFEDMLPKLLGYIFDILSKALRIKHSVNLRDYPRMADFAFWGEVISQAMGYEPLEFIKVYYQNIGMQNIEAIEANPLAQAILKLIIECENKNPLASAQYSAQMRDFKDELELIAENNKLDVESKLWPKSPSVLSRRLKEIKSNLLEGFGIDVVIERDTSKNTSFVKIYKTPPLSSLAPNNQNHKVSLDNFTGGTKPMGGTNSPGLLTSPEKLLEAHAQIDIHGDPGGAGCTMRNTMTKERENRDY